MGWLTLNPDPTHGSAATLFVRVAARLQTYDRWAWVTPSRLELGANIALFVPVGLFLLLLVGTRLWHADDRPEPGARRPAPRRSAASTVTWRPHLRAGAGRGRRHPSTLDRERGGGADSTR